MASTMADIAKTKASTSLQRMDPLHNHQSTIADGKHTSQSQECFLIQWQAMPYNRFLTYTDM